MIHLIKGTENYFIHSDGFVFRTQNGKEIKVEPFEEHKKTKRLVVKVRKKKYLLHMLMYQYFFPEIKDVQKLSYSRTQHNTIPVKNIAVKDLSLDRLDDNATTLMRNYNCFRKAGSANARCTKQISPLEVYETLKIHNFKCIYCGDNLVANDWHLDHYYPLSKGGKNIFNNIVPACSTCNVMKGTLLGEEFYKQCRKITRGFAFKPKGKYLEVLDEHFRTNRI